MVRFFCLLLLSISILFAGGCTEVDRLQDDMADIQNRMVALESLCKGLNNNIDAIQAIVEASQSGNYITGVTPFIYDGKEIGYTISFVKGDPITIYHGKDGNNPGIGVNKDVDDIWYWTVDGEWLLDSDGQKVKASGADGDFLLLSVSEDSTHVYFTLANGSVLALQKASKGSIKMALGSYIPALESREVRIYYKSLFAVYDVNRYQVIVDGPVGTPYPRFWSFMPSSSDSGKSYDVSFSLVDDDGSIIASKTTSIRCISSPSFGKKNILVLGASNYEPGTITKEMCRQLTQTGGSPSGYGLSDIYFIGRLTGSIATDIHQDATGGWSWITFTGNGDNNPFYNPSSKRVDFKYYSQQYCKGEPIDVLCIEFGLNSISKNMSILESNIKPFLRQFHMDYPNGVIIYGGLLPPSQKGGLGVNYGSSSEWNWLTLFRNIVDYNNVVDEICQDADFCDFVFYWPAYEMFDSENSYPTSEISSNLRTGATEIIEVNGVHPTFEARLQLADSGVPAICYALSR